MAAGTGSAARASLGRLVFVGAVHEALPALSALLDSPVDVAEVITLPLDRGARTSGLVDLEPLAASRGVPVRRTVDINAPELVEHVGQLAPDLLVVVGWTRLLGPDLLGVPARGCIGFHASLLPRHRGRAPVNWAILRGETVTGNTMMYLDVGTDTGDIVDQRRVPIGPDDTCATVYGSVAEVGAAMLRDHLPGLLSGTAPRRPQGPPDGQNLPKRTPEMGVTAWARPARAVHDWIRALTQPYPGAFTHWNGRKVMLWRSAPPVGADPDVGLPGEVLVCAEDGVWVATSSGRLLVTAVSDPGSPPCPATEWARRNGLAPGAQFDEVDEATSLWALGLGPQPAPFDGGRV